MLAFGITNEQEIKEINQDILLMIEEGESALRLTRAKEGKSSFGADRLQKEAVLKPHTPKKKERRIFVLSSINELRVSFIKSYQSLCQYCAECLSSMRSLFGAFQCAGHLASWPRPAYRWLMLLLSKFRPNY